MTRKRLPQSALQAPSSTRRLLLTEDPAFRDLNMDDLGPEWDNTLTDGLEDLEWDEDE